MCQLEKRRANEIAKPLTFTVCKLELRGKGIVSQSRSRRTRFSRGQLWAKRKKSDVQTKEQVPQRGFKEELVTEMRSQEPIMKNDSGLFLEVAPP